MAIIRQELTSTTDPANGLRSVTYLEYDDAQSNLLLRIGCDNQTSKADYIEITAAGQTRSHTCPPGEAHALDVSALNVHGTNTVTKYGQAVVTWPFSVQSRWPA